MANARIEKKIMKRQHDTEVDRKPELRTDTEDDGPLLVKIPTRIQEAVLRIAQRRGLIED